jgi:hypothetical protein
MPYLRCCRCGLQFKIQADYLRIENCPRCLARSATIAPLTLSARRIVPAAGWGVPQGRADELPPARGDVLPARPHAD